MLGRLLRYVMPVLALGAAGPVAAGTSPARDWIATTAAHATAGWSHAERLDLPSGSLFVGDPSWGGDYHLRGALPVGVPGLDIWVLASDSGQRVHLVWLEAAGTLPVRPAETINFGIDSAYFAFGDLHTGQQLAAIGDHDPFVANDSFEFMLPHIQRDDFRWAAISVPPAGSPVHAVNTRSDGGLRAVWVLDAEGALSGILIDVTGRSADQRHLDLLLPWE